MNVLPNGSTRLPAPSAKPPTNTVKVVFGASAAAGVSVSCLRSALSEIDPATLLPLADNVTAMLPIVTGLIAALTSTDTLALSGTSDVPSAGLTVTTVGRATCAAVPVVKLVNVDPF